MLVFMLLSMAADAWACEGCSKALAWQRLDLRAQKFILGASSTVQWTISADPETDVDWIDPDGIEGVKGAPIDPESKIVRLGYTSDFLNRHFDTVLWMNAADGAALQYETGDTGGRPRHRIFRFTDQGAFQRTWRPNENEAKLPWTEWGDRQADFRPFQPEAHGQVVIDPLGLIYILAASDLGRGVDQMKILAFVGRDVSRAVLTAGELVNIDADFTVKGSSGEKWCKGRYQALRISLGVEQVGASTDTDFDFLGLQSDIEIYLSPASRMPIQISGRAKVVGRLVIKTKTGHLIDDRGCPDRITSHVPVPAGESGPA
jgi:hypothetical protein